nr:AraC family transcriptional regulator [Sinorhizobium mexicanum]
MEAPSSKRQVTVVIVQKPKEDVLSSVLECLHARALCSMRLEAAGRWAIHFPLPRVVKFDVVRRGECWLRLSDAEPVRIGAGDCVIVAGVPYELASDPDTPAIPAQELFATGGIAQIGDTPDFAVLGGTLQLDAVDSLFVTGVLPSVVVMRADEMAPVGWLLEQLDREWNSGMPGARLASNDLMRLAFIHGLRAHLAKLGEGVGWPHGLIDRNLAPAMQAIHAEPMRAWTVSELARIAGQSRSGFAARFRARVGLSPIEYLARWRVRLAAARLRRSDAPISRIAMELGFATDSGFSAMFRRVTGMSPRQYRSRRGESVMALEPEVHARVRPPRAG